MYYLLIYHTVSDYLERRSQYREAHLKLVQKAHEHGNLLMAGALEDPADMAVLVFKAESPKMAAEFARNDPYVIHGLVKTWEVRPWNVVIGG